MAEQSQARKSAIRARNREVDECLASARIAVSCSDEAGGNETETRELRTALRALIQAVEALRHRD